jgi:hypothetical protein
VQKQGDLRPMRGRPNALSEIADILDERAALYAQADLVFDTDRLTAAQIVARI